MKAQTVKNAVIVPVGAKGGFVVKRGDSRDVLPDLHPRAARAHRQPGRRSRSCRPRASCATTATTPTSWSRPTRAPAPSPTSPTSSPPSTATGWVTRSPRAGRRGSTTRRWASRRAARGSRCRRTSAPSASTPTPRRCTVVGIGDMSGDVFGNGLLRSPHLRLLAAFDHRHVFVDPDPDPAASFAERRRLFELPTSSWADYDPMVLSAGGGVYERGAKSVDLVARGTRARSASTTGRSPPTSWCSAILRAPVDLLWNGGIGTFVKATTESDADVGDRTNDAVRIDATELRCRVVAEGGNLGLHPAGAGRVRPRRRPHQHRRHRQLGRRRLLRPRGEHQDPPAARHRGGSARRPRSATRSSSHMTDAVADLVLADNEAQANALEIAAVEARRPRRRARPPDGAARAVGRARPRARGAADRPRRCRSATPPASGSRRPSSRCCSPTPSSSSSARWSRPTCPTIPTSTARLRRRTSHPTLRTGYDAAIASHPLRREIVATVTANAVVNRAGISFLSRLCDETGAVAPGPGACARRSRVRCSTPAPRGRRSTRSTSSVPAAVQDEMFLARPAPGRAGGALAGASRRRRWRSGPPSTGSVPACRRSSPRCPSSSGAAGRPGSWSGAGRAPRPGAAGRRERRRGGGASRGRAGRRAAASTR